MLKLAHFLKSGQLWPFKHILVSSRVSNRFKVHICVFLPRTSIGLDHVSEHPLDSVNRKLQDSNPGQLGVRPFYAHLTPLKLFYDRAADVGDNC